jgi:N-acetylneuraminic acid mutarotase
MWQTTTFDSTSGFDGSLKYMACCATPFADTAAYQRRIYLGGGVFNNNSQPSSSFYELTPKTIGKPVKRKNMILKRFGHNMVYLNGAVYALGGFSHKDLPNEVPVTLSSCERYTPHDNQWQYISTMNESRAFAACVTMEN